MISKTFSYSFTILFAALIFILSWNSRLAADDYYFIYLTKVYGPFNATILQFNQFSGRWFCHLISTFLLTFADNRYFLPTFFITTFLALYVILSALICKINFKLKNDITKSNSNLLALIILASTFFNSFSIGENWFWFISVTTYLWSFICTLIISLFLLNDKKSVSLSAASLLCSIYIGSSSESIALSIVLLLFSYSVYNIFINGIQSFLKKKESKKIIFVVSIISLALLSSIFSPGSLLRHKLLPSPTILLQFIIFCKSAVKIFLFYLPKQIWIYLLFGSPWLFVGYNLQKKLNLPSKNINKHIVKTISLTLFTVLLCILPNTIILGEFGPARTLLLIPFIFSVCMAIIISLLGMKANNSKYQNTFSFITQFALLSFVLFHAISQYKISREFSTQYDNRINYLDHIQSQGFKGEAKVPSLPDQGFLYNAELRSDTSYFVNQHWKKGLFLDYTMVVSK